jgi:hypothetical protein
MEIKSITAGKRPPQEMQSVTNLSFVQRKENYTRCDHSQLRFFGHPRWMPSE